jgi:ribosomal protein S18 acetylase RimI-like enzyme
LPSLGRAFLARSYYPAMLQDPYASVLVAIEQPSQRVVGFVNVATESGRSLRWLVKRKLAALLTAMLRLLLVEPARVIEAFAIVHARVVMPDDAGEIAFIAVDRAHQKRGIADRLVEAANQYLLKRGITACCTKTLARNEHVIEFYRKHWRARVFASSTIRGKHYRYLVWKLDADSVGEPSKDTARPR